MTFAPSGNSIRWLAFRNDAGQSIPAFAALRPLGVVELAGEAVLRVGQPNADGATGLFNGPFAVDADGLGSCTSDLPCYAAYDTLHTPAVGEMWGPVAGQWTLARDKPGYRIVGGAIDGRVQVMAARESALRWAKAIANWANASGNNSTVSCQQATDKSGALALDGGGSPLPVTIYLPRSGFGDPNVRAGDVIAYQLDANGAAICVSDYLDDPLGTVKLWRGIETDVRGGWRILASAEGRFPVGVTTSDEDIPAVVPLATGGEKRHLHDYRAAGLATDPRSLSIAAHDDVLTYPTSLTLAPHDAFDTGTEYLIVSSAGATGGTASGTIAGTGTIPLGGSGAVSTSSQVTGVTIPQHAAHQHTVLDTGTIQYAVGAGNVDVFVNNIGLGHGTTSENNNLSHVVSDPGHLHTVSIGAIAAGLTLNAADVADDLVVSGISFTIPAHSHEITPNPHRHTVPELAHELTPNPHVHALPPLAHTLTPNPHDHALPNSPEAKHIPPWFGIYFIERFE
jgi:hypothetical protein